MKTTPTPASNKIAHKQPAQIYHEKVPKEVQANQHQLSNTEAIQPPPDLDDELEQLISLEKGIGLPEEPRYDNPDPPQAYQFEIRQDANNEEDFLVSIKG